MFDSLLKTIFNETVNESNSSIKNEISSSTKNKTVNESNSSTKNKRKRDNKSDYKNDSYSDNYSDNESDNKNYNKNKKYTYYDKTKELNNWFETIDQTKSLEDQIEILKTKDFLDYYWYVSYYNDNKDLNYKLFKAKAAYLLNDLDEHLFEKIFGCKFTTLVKKLINTVDKKENQITIENIKNNRDKIYNEYSYDKYVVRHSGDLSDAVKIILEINEALKSDKANNDSMETLKSDKVNNNLMELYKI